MQIRFIDSQAVPGGKAVALCDDQGVILPMQKRAVLESGVGEIATITVTFAVDGKINRIVEASNGDDCSN